MGMQLTREPRTMHRSTRCKLSAIRRHPWGPAFTLIIQVDGTAITQESQ